MKAKPFVGRQQTIGKQLQKKTKIKTSISVCSFGKQRAAGSGRPGFIKAIPLFARFLTFGESLQKKNETKNCNFNAQTCEGI